MLKLKDGTFSQPTTVKTIDILRLINGVNKLSEKSKKLEQMMVAAVESNNETQIDEDLLQQEGIGYDHANQVYFDLNTGEIIDL